MSLNVKVMLSRHPHRPPPIIGSLRRAVSKTILCYIKYMDEKAANRKAKKNLEYAAAIILCWTPKEKRNYYINYFISLMKDSQ